MKTGKILCLSALAGTIFLFACKQDAKQSNTNSAPDPASVKPEVIIYVTTVDKLNLRDQPDKNGKVVAQLAEGEFVEGTGDVSANKEEVMLRGLTYVEPYFKVVSGTSEQKTGWVFGGALQRIYAGSRAGSPDRDKLTPLTSLLKTLDAKQLDSGKKAWDFVGTHFAGAGGPLADAVFILLENFLRRMEHEGEFYKLTEKVKWSDEDYTAIDGNTFDMNKYPLTRSLAENGFALAQGEGMVFPIVDWNKLQTFFNPKAGPAMKIYLDQQTAERNMPAWDDGGIIISLEKLADRAAFWEKFNRENPYFVLTEQTKESERWTRLVLLNGADNTPTFDYETQAISEDYKKVWAYIQEKYPGTVLAAKSSEIADLCAAEGWKRTKKVEDWQMKYAEENIN